MLSPLASAERGTKFFVVPSNGHTEALALDGTSSSIFTIQQVFAELGNDIL